MGRSCWDKGCDFEQSKRLCESSESGYSQLARINSPYENQMVGKLLRKFGRFDAFTKTKTYYWFYNDLRERGNGDYTWSDGSITNYTNW